MNFLKVREEKIPEVLKEQAQWVAWRAAVKQDGKTAKIPIDAKTGKNASTSNPTTWTSFENAFRYYRGHRKEGIRGVGFVLTGGDPFVGIDLDNCRDPETGEIHPWATDTVELIKSYSEISPSGKGIRIVASGELPDGGRKKGIIEMYAQKRFLTITGHHLYGTPVKIMKKPKTILELHHAVFGSEETQISKKAPAPNPNTVPPADEEILKLAMAAKNGEKFNQLWRGDTAGYPSPSEADLALCSILSFWTGRDRVIMDWLFRRSGLMRPKWDEIHNSEKQTYGQMTIDKAIASCTKVYGADASQSPVSELPDLLDICKADPKKAVLNIVNRGALKELATLSIKDPSAYLKFIMELKPIIPVRDMDSLKKAMAAEKKMLDTSSQERKETSLISIRDLLPDAPVPKEFVLPAKWTITIEGVFKSKGAKK